MTVIISKSRIDKWLWAVRFFKTRSMAADAVKGGKVKVNGSSVKPSHEVKPGEIITITKGVVKYQYKVTGIQDKRVSALLAKNFYEDITPQEEINKLLTLENMPSAFRDRGTGRPTKKDRRDIDKWNEQD